MQFTERQLQIIGVLVSNAVEDTALQYQNLKEQQGILDIELHAYRSELESLERRVVGALETGKWAPDDEFWTGEEDQYEPTPEDLADLDAEYDGHDCDPSHYSFRTQQVE